MSERSAGTTGRLQVRNAVPTRADPERMSADERIQEVAVLLAVGFLRHLAVRAADGGEKGLAILRTPSEVCVEPTSEGESV